MTLPKAIEILSRISYGDTLTVKYDIDSANKLGIEALKCVRKIRYHPFPDEVLLLPGETTD